MVTIPVNNDIPRKQYTAIAAQTDFVYDWFSFSNEDFLVYKDDALQVLGAGQDYTVTGVGTENGGNIVFNSAMAGGEIITIEGSTEIERVVDLQQVGKFDPDFYNTEQDRNIVIMKELRRDLDRKVGLEVTSTTDLATLLANLNILTAAADDIAIVAADVDGDNNLATVAVDLDGDDDIGTVADNITNVNAVADSIASVNTVVNLVGYNRKTSAGDINLTSSSKVRQYIDKASADTTTVNLPAGANGLEFLIKDSKGDAQSNNITINPDGSETIDGESSLVINRNYSARHIQWNGDEWSIIG